MFPEAKSHAPGISKPEVYIIQTIENRQSDEMCIYFTKYIAQLKVADSLQLNVLFSVEGLP